MGAEAGLDEPRCSCVCVVFSSASGTAGMSPVCLLAPFIPGKNWDADEATAAMGTHGPKYQKLLRIIPSHPETGSRQLKKQGANSL